MSRMKTFFKYFLAFVIVYILVDLGSYMAIKSRYETKSCNIGFDTPQVSITESKSTITNGYVKGLFTNNTGETLVGKVLKLDCLSPRNVLMGTKYIKLPDLEPGASIPFESKFNYDNVDHVDISMTEMSELSNEESFKFEWDDLSVDKVDWWVWFCAVILVFG